MAEIYSSPWFQGHATGIVSVSTDGQTWTSLPDPSSLTYSVYDLDAGGKTGRGLDGGMNRERVAVKEKINMTFNAMFRADFDKTISLIKTPFFYVKFYSPYYGEWRIAEMYVGDRSIDYYGMMENNKNDLVKSIKFNFIER